MPRGLNSLPGTAHHHPEASLACVVATVRVKRRQRVLKPCDGAPKFLCIHWSLRRIGSGGNTAAPKWCGASSPVGVRREQGKGTGGAFQEPVRSSRLPGKNGQRRRT